MLTYYELIYGRYLDSGCKTWASRSLNRRKHMVYYIILGLFFLILILITAMLKHPSVKGQLGERSVRLELDQLDKEKYLVLNDIYIPNEKGHTSQIDHVVVSLYGIFVIETKNYSGWIFGEENSKYWTQVIYERKEKFLNPIIQNRGHMKALRAILADFADAPFISIVTFSTRATLKGQYDSTVIYTPEITSEINKHDQELIPLENVKEIYERIKLATLHDKNIRQAHTEAIQKGFEETKLKVQNCECPWCGGELVNRHGKYGAFMGCSNYPKCRFTVK